MSVCRCLDCGPPKELAQPYYQHEVAKTEQLAKTEQPVFCGRANCMKPAMAWLTDQEQDRYDEGVRVFKCGGRRVALS